MYRPIMTGTALLPKPNEDCTASFHFVGQIIVPVQHSNKLVKAFDLINCAEVKPLGNYLRLKRVL